MVYASNREPSRQRSSARLRRWPPQARKPMQPYVLFSRHRNQIEALENHADGIATVASHLFFLSGSNGLEPRPHPWSDDRVLPAYLAA